MDEPTNHVAEAGRLPLRSLLAATCGTLLHGPQDSAFTPDAACSMSPATAAGCDRKIEWLPATSTMVAPARSAIERWAGGGIIRSSVATKYQVGLLRHAGSLIVPLRASTPHGTCESAMNAACSALRSPANDAWNFSRSRNRTRPAGAGSAARVRRAADPRSGCSPTRPCPVRRPPRVLVGVPPA